MKKPSREKTAKVITFVRMRQGSWVLAIDVITIFIVIVLLSLAGGYIGYSVLTNYDWGGYYEQGLQYGAWAQNGMGDLLASESNRWVDNQEQSTWGEIEIYWINRVEREDYTGKPEGGYVVVQKSGERESEEPPNVVLNIFEAAESEDRYSAAKEVYDLLKGWTIIPDYLAIEALAKAAKNDPGFLEKSLMPGEEISLEEKIKTMEKPEKDRTTADWVVVGRPNEDVGVWGQVFQAEAYHTKLMKEEQGEDISFSDKAGRPYAERLDAKLAEIAAAAGPQFAERWRLSRGPRWRVLEADGFMLDNVYWREIYNILRNMTEKMAVAPDAETVYAAHDEAMQAIGRLGSLETKNIVPPSWEARLFLDWQMEKFDKSSFFPTPDQIRAYRGDYTTDGPYQWSS